MVSLRRDSFEMHLRMISMELSDRERAMAARAEQLDTRDEHCLDPKHELGGHWWEQGAAAFRADVRIEECPFDPGAEQDDWLRGWMAAELIEFGRFEDLSE